MIDKIAFMETLHSVQEIARTSLTPLTKEEIKTYFKDMELTREQEEMVFQYLQKPQEAMEEAVQEDEREENPQETESGEGRGKHGKEEKAEIKSSAHFQMYLDEIGEIPVLDEETEQMLYQRLVQGEESAVPEICRQWLKPVIAIAGEYVTPGTMLDDVVQEGNIGLLTGLNRLLGSGRADGMKELLEQSVREAIQAYVEEETGEGVQENSILGKVSLVHEAKEMLAKEQESEPSVEQLSAYTKIPEEEIMDILSLAKEVKKQ